MSQIKLADGDTLIYWEDLEELRSWDHRVYKVIVENGHIGRAVIKRDGRMYVGAVLPDYTLDSDTVGPVFLKSGD